MKKLDTAALATVTGGTSKYDKGCKPEPVCAPAPTKCDDKSKKKC